MVLTPGPGEAASKKEGGREGRGVEGEAERSRSRRRAREKVRLKHSS